MSLDPWRNYDSWKLATPPHWEMPDGWDEDEDEEEPEQDSDDPSSPSPDDPEETEDDSELQPEWEFTPETDALPPNPMRVLFTEPRD